MPRAARAEGLSRRHRFSQRGSFGPVLRAGRKLRGRLAVLHLAAAPAGSVARLGIALTRRLVASSVNRNRVKRGVREAFRRHPLRESSLDCVVTLRERVDARSVPEVLAEVRTLMDRAAGERP